VPPKIPLFTEPDTILYTLPPLVALFVVDDKLSSIKLIILFELDTATLLPVYAALANPLPFNSAKFNCQVTEFSIS
jgi:hypothetical protein